MAKGRDWLCVRVIHTWKSRMRSARIENATGGEFYLNIEADWAFAIVDGMPELHCLEPGGMDY